MVAIYVSIIGLIISMIALVRTLDIYIGGVSKSYTTLYRTTINGYTLGRHRGTLNETLNYAKIYHPNFRAIVAPSSSNIYDIIDRQIKGPGFMPIEESSNHVTYVISSPKDKNRYRQDVYELL